MRERIFPSNRAPYNPYEKQAPYELAVTYVEKEIDGIVIYVPTEQRVNLPLPDPNDGITVDDFDPIELSKAGYNVKSPVLDRGLADVESAFNRIS